MENKTKYFLFFFYFFFLINSYGQTIYTIAGNKSFGFAADSTRAINAPLNNSITCVKMGYDGYIYFNDGYNNRIRKIDTLTNIIYTVAGNGKIGFSGDGGLALSASLNGAIAFTLDKSGNIFICDTYNNRIRKVDAKTGNINTIAGNGSSNYSDNTLADTTGLPKPISIDIDSSGNLYIGTSDIYNYQDNYIFKLDTTTGIIKKIAGNNGSGIYTGSGSVALQTGFYISGLRVNKSGDIYFTDPFHNCILKYSNTDATINTIAGQSSSSIGDYKGDGGLAVNAFFNAPIDLDFDSFGNILIVDEGNNVIRRIDSATGIINTIAGIGRQSSLYLDTDTVGAKCALLHIYNGVDYYSGITHDAAGSFYFVDFGNSIIRKYDTISIIPKNPVLSIATLATNICPGQTISIKALISDSASIPLNQLICKWIKNNSLAASDSLVYISDSVSNNDSIYCLVQTLNNVCTSVIVKSNTLKFSVKSVIKPTAYITTSDSSICYNQVDTFKVFVTKSLNSSITYQWALNGNKINSFNDSIYITSNLQNGDAVLCNIITSDSSCNEALTASSNVINITVKPLPTVELFPEDTIINAGNHLQLKAVVSSNVISYSWNPYDYLTNINTLDPISSPLKTITYYFTAKSTDNCIATKSLLIKISFPFFMPNSFTPNNDGKNDVFRIPPNISIDLKELAIYNRFGQKIFATSNINSGWDGTIAGVKQPIGTYVYMVSGSFNGQPIFSKGTFVLIR